MQRLAIPLDRSSHTTRPHRRVVWLLVLIAPAFCAFFIAGWWFERPDIGAMAPEGTQIAIRLQPGPDQWERVLQAIGHLTAVSDRALTLREIAPYSAGELTLFIDARGRRSTTIRATSKKIPHDLLDAYGIAVQTSENGYVLLTDRIRPTEHIALPRPRPWMGFGRIGTVYLWSEKAWDAGILSRTAHGWSLRLPRQKLARNPFNRLPGGTIAFLATPVLTNDLDVSGVTERMESLLAPFDLPSVDMFGKELLQNEGGIIIAEHKKQMSFLLGGQGKAIQEDGWRKLLLAAAAFRHPKTQTWLLPDNTRAQEIRVDPSSVTVEERTVLGNKVLQVRPQQDEIFLLALQNGGKYAFSDNESLLNAWLGQKPTTGIAEGTCEQGRPSAYLDLQKLYGLSQSDLTFHTPSMIRDLSQTFRALSLKNSLFSSVFQLCF